MIDGKSTLKQLRFFLNSELRKIYAEEESSSLARIILEHFGFPPDALLSNPLLVPDPPITRQIKEIIAEMHTGKPLQYILGYTYFCDLQISINQNVLIPRPETEEMVFRISEGLKSPPRRIIDLGTGSGCIALALKHKYPLADVYGIDHNPKALQVARKNGSDLKLDITWIKMDLLSDEVHLDGAFDLIVSNPPYVLKSERVEMERNVLDFEPGSALFVEDHDPLKYYRIISKIGSSRLLPNGFLWFEINERFGKKTSDLLVAEGFRNVAIVKDIHEKERFIRAVRV